MSTVPVDTKRESESSSGIEAAVREGLRGEDPVVVAKSALSRNEKTNPQMQLDFGPDHPHEPSRPDNRDACVRMMEEGLVSDNKGCRNFNGLKLQGPAISIAFDARRFGSNYLGISSPMIRLGFSNGLGFVRLSDEWLYRNRSSFDFSNQNGAVNIRGALLETELFQRWGRDTYLRIGANVLRNDDVPYRTSFDWIGTGVGIFHQLMGRGLSEQAGSIVGGQARLRRMPYLALSLTTDMNLVQETNSTATASICSGRESCETAAEINLINTTAANVEGIILFPDTVLGAIALRGVAGAKYQSRGNNVYAFFDIGLVKLWGLDLECSLLFHLGYSNNFGENFGLRMQWQFYRAVP